MKGLKEDEKDEDDINTVHLSTNSLLYSKHNQSKTQLTSPVYPTNTNHWTLTREGGDGTR